MIKLSIVIVNYNTHNFVRDCINSVKQYCMNIKYEIIVVDNNSPDKEIVNLKDEYRDVKFIFLKENKGFGTGCNTGFNRSEGEYILFLNPDIKVKNDSIGKLVDYYISNSNLGTVSGLLMDENDELLYSYNYFPNLTWEFKEAYGLCLNKSINGLLNRSEIKNKNPFEVDWFHGACLLIKRDIFEEVRGFDENIFLYYEDTDLQRKIKNSGYDVVCVPEAVFYHYSRSSIRNTGLDKVYHYYMHKSKIYYYKKYHKGIHLFIIRILYISGTLFKAVSILFRPKLWKDFTVRLKNYIIIIKVYLNIKMNIN